MEKKERTEIYRKINVCMKGETEEWEKSFVIFVKDFTHTNYIYIYIWIYV